MSCKYYLKGKEFSSEHALDEFLMTVESYYDQLGDEVYQLPPVQAGIKSKLLDLNKPKDKLIKEGVITREVTTNEYSDSSYTVNLPKIGVSEFLREYIKADGTPLFEKFNSEDYWKEKRKQWQNPKYWLGGPDGATLQEVEEVFGKGVTQGRPIVDQSEFEEIKAKIEDKWKHQSYLGTALHAAMNSYWKAIKYPNKINPNDTNSLLTFIRDELNKRHLNEKDPNSSLLYEFLRHDQDIFLKSIIKHAQNIHKELLEKFSVKNSKGELIEPLFLSEIGLVTDVVQNNEQTQLVGIADLLVIDGHGNIHVIDYKTSPKTYHNYNAYKKKTFYYQLATYRRILERYFNLNEQSRAFVIPLHFKDFEVENGEMKYSDIGSVALDDDGNVVGSYLEELSILIGDESEGIMQNLDTFLPIHVITDATPEEIAEETDEFMKDCFTSYVSSQELTLEKVKEKIKKQNGGKFEKDKTTGKYKYQFGNETILEDTDTALIQKVYEKYESMRKTSHYNAQGLRGLIRNKDLTKLPKMNRVRLHGTDGQLQRTLSRYIADGWEIVDAPKVVDDYNIILLRNTKTYQIDAIKVSDVVWQELDDVVKLGGVTENDVDNVNSTLTGTFENDVVQKQRPKSQVLDSNYGNIEMMQTMHVLSKLPKLFGSENALGRILVVDLKKDSMLEASNSQLLYNFNALYNLRNKHKNLKLQKNNFETRAINVLSYVALLDRQFREIMARENDMFLNKTKWSNLKQCTTNFDSYQGNINQLRYEIIKFIKEIETQFGLSPDSISLYDEFESPQHRLYYNALMAVAELDKIDFKQQSVDHSSWYQKGVLGWAGNQLDNPGNMLSSTLNTVAEQNNIAYQNVRDDVTKVNAELRKKLNALKQHKKYTWLYTRTVGNQTDLYENMFDKEHGKFLFKNPWDSNVDLDDYERDFLQFVVLQINKNRYNDVKSLEDLFAKMEKDGNEVILRVPLTEGTTASKVSVEGLLETLKMKLEALSPTNIKNTAKEKIEGFIANTDSNDNIKYTKAKMGELWEMTNYFDAGEIENVRLNWFSDKAKGIGFFEHNLETLVLKHTFAHSMKENMDEVFPVIKAARVHLFMQGTIINDQFTQDIKYLSDYVKAKIFNMSLQSDNMQVVMYVVGELMEMTSKMALAFNPRQLYQALDGIYKDVSLVWRKPDGENSFSKKDMKDSFFWIYNDLRHFGDEKSLGELLNEQYGINDMDMNSYVQKINSDNVGIWNFWNVGFRFASRPDYYNRMTLFGAQMRGDGCFDAHSVKDGRLVYDWTKDKRFSIYAENWNNPSMYNDPEFKKQKALYIATAKQFMAEHAKNEDGTEFVLDLNNPKPLPKAYTIQQSESMKALSDLTYGYYSHEKKSLIQSTSIGAMFFQMATYWSSKKNQYLAPGGVRMRGRMVQYVENGVPMFHKLDENGEPTDEMTEEDTGVPFMRWAGQWQEGILVTLYSMAKDLYQGDSLGTMWDKYYNNQNENLRRAYRNNIKQFVVDMSAAFFLGNLVAPSLLEATKEYTKDVGNETFEKAFVNNCLVNTAAMFKSSTDDFKFISAIFGKSLEWTPMSIGSIDRTIENICKMISGDRDLYDGLINIFAATRGQEPLFDYIKIATLGRSIGDNGREE